MAVEGHMACIFFKLLLQDAVPSPKMQCGMTWPAPLNHRLCNTQNLTDLQHEGRVTVVRAGHLKMFLTKPVPLPPSHTDALLTCLLLRCVPATAILERVMPQ